MTKSPPKTHFSPNKSKKSSYLHDYLAGNHVYSILFTESMFKSVSHLILRFNRAQGDEYELWPPECRNLGGDKHM